jgi:hypothetical protein
VCLLAAESKMARAEGKKCHAKTMMSINANIKHPTCAARKKGKKK